MIERLLSWGGAPEAPKAILDGLHANNNCLIYICQWAVVLVEPLDI